MKTILAFDPGSQKTGWAVLQYEPLTYVKSGTFFFSKSDLYTRLLELKTQLHLLLTEIPPVHHLILEEAFVGLNKQSALTLSHVRGVILGICGAEYTDYHAYSAKAAKKIITGYGNASKEQIAFMIQALLKISSFASDDESDALALALCHYMTKERALQARSPLAFAQNRS